MSAREVQHHPATAREMFAQSTDQGAAAVSDSPLVVNRICAAHSRGEHPLESASAEGVYDSPGTSALPVTQIDVANLIRALRQVEVIAKRQASRVAFKVKGRILFLDLTEIVAVQAEGNYVALRNRPNSYLLRESLSSMQEKLRPYGFVRIHRSVLVNASAVEEIQPLPSGAYRLRVKGGKDYLVTRTYKNNLSDLAQLWVGPELPCLSGSQKISVRSPQNENLSGANRHARKNPLNDYS
jgi:DNA-binding LytR/AlgR family response regulator